jgi:hypothetical protein
VTKWCTTIHTTGGLIAEFIFWHGKMKLIPIMKAIKGGKFGRKFTQEFDKASRFAHSLCYLCRLFPIFLHSSIDPRNFTDFFNLIGSSVD